MSTFLGRYVHAIDEKGRVPLPARFRNGADTDFVAVRGIGGCLSVYPRTGWPAVAERIQRLHRSGDPESRRQALAITAHAADLTLDKHGRLSLPQPLLEVAGLEREALFVGAGEHIQIWNPERFDEYLGPVQERYDQFAASIL